MSVGTEIVPVQRYSLPDVVDMANRVAAGRMFGDGNADATFTLMLLAQAEGLEPIQAMRRYHVIQGKPTMRADAMQAEFQRHGGTVKWIPGKLHEEARARFVHPIHAPEPGIEISLTMKEATERGLTKNPMYQKYPGPMLRARVISEGVRMVLPGVVVGIYTPEEVEGFIDITPEPARALPARVEGPVELPTSRGAVNATFAPPQAGGPPKSRDEKVKLISDRYGAHGQDIRPWHKLAEEEIGIKNAAFRGKLEELGLENEAREMLGIYQLNRHMLKWAIAERVVEDPETEIEANGKPKRLKDRQIVALMATTYARDDASRNGLRRELKRYLKAKYEEACQVAENQAHGDAPGPAEEESQEPAGQLEPALSNGRGDAWEPPQE